MSSGFGSLLMSVCLYAFLGVAHAQQEPPTIDLPAVQDPASPEQKASPLTTPGRLIIIEFHQGKGSKIEGTFLTSDARGITVRKKNGAEVTAPWGSVRKVRAKRTFYGMWIGLATGAALAGTALATDDSSSDAVWGAAWVAMGAATGAVAGQQLDPGSRSPLYEAPKTESAAPSAGRRKTDPGRRRRQ